METAALLAPADTQRPIAMHGGAIVRLDEFRAHAAAIAQRLPAGSSMINLCEDRYCFLAAYAAALSAGHTVLLPSSRAEQVVSEIEATHPGSYRCADAAVQAAWRGSPAPSTLEERIAAERTVMSGFTSGSTARPREYPKRWRSLHMTTALNARTIRDTLGCDSAQTLWILATVPPQHMYGVELSVLLPLLAGMAVHSGRPLFPADVALALAELPAPRVLVSTPVHLRAMVESRQAFPAVDLVVSATAPLDQRLASAIESRLGAPLLEMFGSTETCVIAHRRTSVQALWHLHAGIELTPGESGSQVSAPWLVEPVPLQDTVEMHGTEYFRVLGRNSDMIEVAGKRASLADLTQRLLAIHGVVDAVVFQPEEPAVAAIRRVAALVVAPERTAREILDQLAASVDPAFLPRPLVIVEALPRNDLGKLPHAALLQALRRG